MKQVVRHITKSRPLLLACFALVAAVAIGVHRASGSNSSMQRVYWDSDWSLGRRPIMIVCDPGIDLPAGYRVVGQTVSIGFMHIEQRYPEAEWYGVEPRGSTWVRLPAVSQPRDAGPRLEWNALHNNLTWLEQGDSLRPARFLRAYLSTDRARFTHLSFYDSAYHSNRSVKWPAAFTDVYEGDVSGLGYDLQAKVEAELKAGNSTCALQCIRCIASLVSAESSIPYPAGFVLYTSNHSAPAPIAPMYRGLSVLQQLHDTIATAAGGGVQSARLAPAREYINDVLYTWNRLGAVWASVPEPNISDQAGYGRREFSLRQTVLRQMPQEMAKLDAALVAAIATAPQSKRH